MHSFYNLLNYHFGITVAHHSNEILFLEIIMKKIVLVILLIGLMTACASKTEKNVNEKVAKEPGVYTSTGVVERSHQIINESASLSMKQKKELLTLHEKTRGEMAKIRFQMGKLKGLFFKTLIRFGPDHKEINILKKKMAKLHGQKLDVMLESLEEAKGILGKLRDEKIYETFMYEEAPRAKK